MENCFPFATTLRTLLKNDDGNNFFVSIGPSGHYLVVYLGKYLKIRTKEKVKSTAKENEKCQLD